MLTSTFVYITVEPNDEEWIRFDLGDVQQVYTICTKGRSDYDQYVTTYKFQYTTDSSVTEGETTWTTYRDECGEDMVTITCYLMTSSKSHFRGVLTVLSQIPSISN